MIEVVMTDRRALRNGLLMILSAAAIAVSLHPARADRMALWTIVHDKCVVDFKEGANPKPCDAVDISGGEDSGIALLKDHHGVAQMLAIPTRRVTGIEDPAALATGADHYFAAAWAGRARLEAHLGHPAPREAIGLSINSEYSRSQDQLHIHVDCVDKDVAAELKAYAGSLDEQFRPMTVALKGRRYWARRLDSADLSDVAPLRLLADGVEGARARMGQWSLAAIAFDFAGKPGFILLADPAELTGGGHAEDLQDHECLITAPKT